MSKDTQSNNNAKNGNRSMPDHSNHQNSVKNKIMHSHAVTTGVNTGKKAKRVAIDSSRKFMRPIDHLMRVSRIVRIIFIISFAATTLSITSLIGYQIAHLLWFNDTIADDEGAADLLVNPAAPDSEIGTFVETRAANRNRYNLSKMVFIDSDNQIVDNKIFKGKVVLVNYWATWCAPCVKELPKLSQMSQIWKNRDVYIIAASEDLNGWDQVKPFVLKNNISNLPIVLDQNQQGLKNFDIKGLPTTIFFDRNGIERGRIAGYYDWESPAAMNLLQKFAE